MNEQTALAYTEEQDIEEVDDATMATVVDLKAKKEEAEVSYAERIFNEACESIYDNDVYLKKSATGANDTAREALKKSIFMAIWFIQNPKEAEVFYQSILCGLDPKDGEDKKLLRTLNSSRSKWKYYKPIKFAFFHRGLNLDLDDGKAFNGGAVLNSTTVKWWMTAFACIAEWVAYQNERYQSQPELIINEKNFDDWFASDEVGKGSVRKWYDYAKDKLPKKPKKKSESKAPPETASGSDANSDGSTIIKKHNQRNMGVIVFDMDLHGELLLNFVKSTESKDDAFDSLYAELIHTGTISEGLLGTLQDESSDLDAA